MSERASDDGQSPKTVRPPSEPSPAKTPRNTPKTQKKTRSPPPSLPLDKSTFSPDRRASHQSMPSPFIFARTPRSPWVGKSHTTPITPKSPLAQAQSRSMRASLASIHHDAAGNPHKIEAEDIPSVEQPDGTRLPKEMIDLEKSNKTIDAANSVRLVYQLLACNSHLAGIKMIQHKNRLRLESEEGLLVDLPFPDELSEKDLPSTEQLENDDLSIKVMKLAQALCKKNPYDSEAKYLSWTLSWEHGAIAIVSGKGLLKYLRQWFSDKVDTTCEGAVATKAASKRLIKQTRTKASQGTITTFNGGRRVVRDYWTHSVVAFLSFILLYVLGNSVSYVPHLWDEYHENLRSRAVSVSSHIMPETTAILPARPSFTWPSMPHFNYGLPARPSFTWPSVPDLKSGLPSRSSLIWPKTNYFDSTLAGLSTIASRLPTLSSFEKPTTLLEYVPTKTGILDWSHAFGRTVWDLVVTNGWPLTWVMTFLAILSVLYLSYLSWPTLKEAPVKAWAHIANPSRRFLEILGAASLVLADGIVRWVYGFSPTEHLFTLVSDLCRAAPHWVWIATIASLAPACFIYLVLTDSWWTELFFNIPYLLIHGLLKSRDDILAVLAHTITIVVLILSGIMVLGYLYGGATLHYLWTFLHGFNTVQLTCAALGIVLPALAFATIKQVGWPKVKNQAANVRKNFGDTMIKLYQDHPWIPFIVLAVIAALVDQLLLPQLFTNLPIGLAFHAWTFYPQVLRCLGGVALVYYFWPIIVRGCKAAYGFLGPFLNFLLVLGNIFLTPTLELLKTCLWWMKDKLEFSLFALKQIGVSDMFLWAVFIAILTNMIHEAINWYWRGWRGNVAFDVEVRYPEDASIVGPRVTVF